MTDFSPHVAEPPPAAGEVNGPCDPEDSPQQLQEDSTESRGEGLKMEQEMKITESIEDRGR